MNEICWLAIPSTDVARAKGFYEGLFGWTTKGDADSGFLEFKPARKPGGAIMRVAEIKTPAPTVYVSVEDVAAAAEKAVALGGAVVVPPTEEEAGTFAIITDADGVRLGLWQVKKK